MSAQFSQQCELSRLQSGASKMRIIENRYPADGFPKDGAVARRWWRELIDHITHSSEADRVPRLPIIRKSQRASKTLAWIGSIYTYIPGHIPIMDTCLI